MSSAQPKARIIRSDSPLLVTIDGPAGTGKSSVALALARRLSASFLDTGAMYRAAAYIVLQRGLRVDDEPSIVQAVIAANIGFNWRADPPMVIAEGKELGELIRTPEVTQVVSPIATLPRLRAHMVTLQQAISRQRSRLVTEGRDQGTAVFPRADVKIYLDAHPAVRAGRRAVQLANAGQSPGLATVLRDILERDWLDQNRVTDPLKPAPDAELVDTSAMSKDVVVDTLDQIVRART